MLRERSKSASLILLIAEASEWFHAAFLEMRWFNVRVPKKYSRYSIKKFIKQSTVNKQRPTINNHASRMCLLRCYAGSFALCCSRLNESFVQNQTDSFLCCPSISPLRTHLSDSATVAYSFFRIFGERTVGISMVHWAIGLTLSWYSAVCLLLVNKR